MKAAREPSSDIAGRKLLLIQGVGTRDLHVRNLPEILEPGDLVVVNDSATVPASIAAVAPDGSACEIRLARELSPGRWEAVLFGAGDWRMRTEERGAPPSLLPDDELRLGADAVRVLALSPHSPRLVEIAIDWNVIYRLGRPIQYSYLARDLALWDVQLAYAGEPWATEMPSAGRNLSWETLARLRERDITVAPLTHATGLSSTGDPNLDSLFPRPERYRIPPSTWQAVRSARRVIAIGTSVVRAIESAALTGELQGWTDLRIDARFRPRIVAGVLSGLHLAPESHFELLQAFAPRATLESALRHAEARGYENHEFGDVMLCLGA